MAPTSDLRPPIRCSCLISPLGPGEKKLQGSQGHHSPPARRSSVLSETLGSKSSGAPPEASKERHLGQPGSFLAASSRSPSHSLPAWGPCPPRAQTEGTLILRSQTRRGGPSPCPANQAPGDKTDLTPVPDPRRPGLPRWPCHPCSGRRVKPHTTPRCLGQPRSQRLLPPSTVLPLAVAWRPVLLFACVWTRRLGVPWAGRGAGCPQLAVGVHPQGGTAHRQPLVSSGKEPEPAHRAKLLDASREPPLGCLSPWRVCDGSLWQSLRAGGRHRPPPVCRGSGTGLRLASRWGAGAAGPGDLTVGSSALGNLPPSKTGTRLGPSWSPQDSWRVPRGLSKPGSWGEDLPVTLNPSKVNSPQLVAETANHKPRGCHVGSCPGSPLATWGGSGASADRERRGWPGHWC